MKLFVYDTETYPFAPGLTAPPLVCVSAVLADPITIPSNGPIPEEVTGLGWLSLPADGVADIHTALLDPTLRIVGHNVGFDMLVLAAEEPGLLPLMFAAYEAGRVSDTSIREKLVAIALGDFSSDFASSKRKNFSMAGIFDKRFSQDLSADKTGPDAWRMRYGELDGLPLDQWPSEAVSYAIGDAEKTYALWCAQASDLESGVVDPETGLVTNEQEQAAADFALKLMGAWGIRTDLAAVTALAAQLEENSRSVREALTGTIFRYKDGTKDTKYLAGLVEAAYASTGATSPLTPSGKTSTSKDVLLAAPTGQQQTVYVWMSDEVTGIRAQQDTPVLLALASISSDEHNAKTFIEPLMGGAHGVPITASWNVLVESGRTSCWGPNWTGIPKAGGYRECCVPRPGNVYIQADYSAVELRALAQYCLDNFGHSAMADAIIAGQDLHLALAATFLGITYEQAVATKKDPAVKKARNAAKSCNFGFGGGMGAAKFVETVRKQISKSAFTDMFTDDPAEALSRATSYKAAWMRQWPEMHEFFALISAQCEAGGGQFAQTVLRSGRVRGGVQYCDGANGAFQSSVSDGMKRAAFLTQSESYTGYSALWTREEHDDVPSPLFGTRLCAVIHDEFLAETPEGSAPEALERMMVVMIASMQMYHPDVPIEAEGSMMRRWSKAADEVRDENRRFLVWEPKK